MDKSSEGQPRPPSGEEVVSRKVVGIVTRDDKIAAAMTFKRYARKGFVEARPYQPGEDLTNVSVNNEDLLRPNLRGGWIARDPANHKDSWYIHATYFTEHYHTEPLEP